MIPQELMQQWEKEAAMLYPLTDLMSVGQKLRQMERCRKHVEKIKLEWMQAEIERLKELVFSAYCEGIKHGEDYSEGFLTWEQFKTQHNL